MIFMIKRNNVCAAVDFGGTKLLIGAVTEEGKILESQTYETGFTQMNQAAEAVMLNLDNFLTTCVPDNCTVTCVGMGLVGQVNRKQGIWEKLYGAENEAGISISKIIGEKYKVPCVIDNDVKTALEAERAMGAGRFNNNFVYVNVGTGIAAGIVCDGAVLRGSDNNAGEIGFFPSRKYSNCKIEDIASGRGIQARLKKLAEETGDKETLTLLRNTVPTIRELFNLKDNGNTVARRVLEEAAEELAFMCEYLIYTCNPDEIIFGGGVMNCDRMLQLVIERINVSKYGYYTKISRTNLDLKTIGLIGAAMLGFQQEGKK